eukprot:CAMPEP_0170451836 /NCGR_PEP_ID=MMETSP0123-20130129/950_1 /TAXON_ID=182087 /ORGANISM="Favella ehrenbergii, Strain Fehren 1" /LENGTH=190 /DNA_ID=CAMNT_0010713671 /DNA_START=506 /DNA_END=1078 /DNA_ORIENTATION=+
MNSCEGCEMIQTEENKEADSADKQLQLELDPGTSDLLVFVHTAAKVSLSVTGRQVQRKISREELLVKTREEGTVKQIEGTDCSMCTYKGPYSYGLLLVGAINPDASSKSLQIQIRLDKVNYRIEGQPEEVSEVERVLSANEEHFIRLEKVNEAVIASVRIAIRYCLIDKEPTEEEIIAKMLEEAHKNVPE